MRDISMAALSVFLVQSLALLALLALAPTLPVCRSRPGSAGGSPGRTHPVGLRPTCGRDARAPRGGSERADLPGETQNENCCSCARPLARYRRQWDNAHARRFIFRRRVW